MTNDQFNALVSRLEEQARRNSAGYQFKVLLLALLGNAYRFMPIRLQSGDLTRIHGIDERIALSDYVGMVQFYAALMRNSGGHLGRSSAAKTETQQHN